MGVVLVVDDDFDFLSVINDTLIYEGWRVLVAASLSAALRAARSCRVDVVLTDVMIPFGGGQTLENNFKADPLLKEVPFVFMSGATRDLCELPHARFLLKPFTGEDANAMLRSCVPTEEGDSTPSLATL